MVAVVTSTTAPVIILLEFAGRLEYLLGLMVSVVFAKAVGNIYTQGFF
jgi:H+/Cl- antiporter ClcA